MVFIRLFLTLVMISAFAGFFGYAITRFLNNQPVLMEVSKTDNVMEKCMINNTHEVCYLFTHQFMLYETKETINNYLKGNNK